jgi:hypothetical protein
MSRAPTSAELRHGIASGRSRDKISNIDPAAAPLGTDDEAAGHPPSQQELKTAAAQELVRDPVPSQRLEPWPIVVLLLAVALIAAGATIGVYVIPQLE